MNESITFREASKADLPDILRLYSQPDLDDGEILSISAAERIFERIACYPDYRIHVAIDAGRVVGMFALLVMDNLAHLGAPSAIVEGVAVDPILQGRGIGKEMMRHAIRLATESGCYKIVLSSNLKRERAHAFYDSLGFERHGYSFRMDIQPAAGDGGARKRAVHRQRGHSRSS